MSTEGRRRLLAAICLILLLAAPGAVSAQVSTASINGTVRDASGSVVPQATVVLKNVGTGIELRSTTNDAGVYAFLNLLPGDYTLEASQQGFRTARVSQFTLVVNQTATYDFTLEVGSIEQSVTVEAMGAEVQSSTAELGAVVSRQQVVDLPLNGRNFTQLLALTPGVAPISVSQNAGGTFTASAIGAFYIPSINGQTNRSNFWTLDGINNQESFNSTYAVPPIIDTIQEFKVNSHNDQVEFGGVLGGTVNVVTKSGTNELHGSAWEYLRNDAFDARSTFLPRVTPFRYNMFGAAGGGPVVIPKLYDGRNKTFFYLGYQGFRLRRPANTFYKVPTDANLRGDLSDVSRQIYNPFSTRVDPNDSTKFIRDPFSGNQIPASLINQGNLKFASTLPKPIVTGVGDRNALDSTPFKQSQNEYTARVDQTIGSKDFLWFRYTGLLLDISQSAGRQGLLSLPERPARNWGASWVHTFSPTSTMQLQMGRVHVRLDSKTRFAGLSEGFIDEVGFSREFACGFIGDVCIIPALNVTNYFSGGESDSLNIPVRIWQFRGNYSKITGSHTLKWGAEVNSNNFESWYRNASSTFNTPQTADPQNLGTTGNELASFLLNVPDSAGRRNVHETMRWGGVIGFYFHDQWKVTPKLTVNLGLRYDRTFIPPYGKEGTEGENGGIETGAYDLNRGVYLIQKLPPTCAERGHAPCIPDPTGKLPDHVEIEPRGKIYHDTTKNFQPRLGLAYRVRPNTALRASIGVFFDNWAAVTQTAQNYEGAWPDAGQQLGNNLNYPSSASATPVVTGHKPFLEGLLPAPTPFNQVQWFMDPFARNPYSFQWNFGFQHQVASDMVVTANYVGSVSRRLDVGGYFNVAYTPGPGEQAPRRPFPYIGPTFYDRSIGNSNYNAFQFLLDKRFSRGLAYMVSYTWSKSIDMACSGWYGVEGCSSQDPYDISKDRSVSGFDLTHVLTINAIYQIPVGPGKAVSTGSRVGDYILGNWQLNGIASFYSGIPYEVGVPGDIANTGNVNCCNGYYMRLNVVGDHKVSNPTRDRWFNKDAFAIPPLYTFGNLGRNALRSDGHVGFDFSLFRQFPIKEATRVEFRAEAFNVFNHPTYGVPVRSFTNANFGKVLGLRQNTGPRQLQLALKILF